MNTDYVLKDRRVVPGKLTLQNPYKEFPNIALRVDIDVSQHLPVFAFQAMINPNNSSVSSDYRRFILDFKPTKATVASHDKAKYFSFAVTKGVPTPSVNPDAPTTIQPSEFEQYIRAYTGGPFSGEWKPNAYPKMIEYYNTWGLKYWIGELAQCREDFVHRARSFATAWQSLLKIENDEQMKLSKKYTVDATITKCARNPLYWILVSS